MAKMPVATHAHHRARRLSYSASRTATLQATAYRVKGEAHVMPSRVSSNRKARNYFLRAHMVADALSGRFYKDADAIWVEANNPSPTEPSAAFPASREPQTRLNNRAELLAVLRQHLGAWVAIRGSYLRKLIGRRRGDVRFPRQDYHANLV